MQRKMERNRARQTRQERQFEYKTLVFEIEHKLASEFQDFEFSFKHTVDMEDSVSQAIQTLELFANIMGVYTLKGDTDRKLWVQVTLAVYCLLIFDNNMEIGSQIWNAFIADNIHNADTTMGIVQNLLVMIVFPIMNVFLQRAFRLISGFGKIISTPKMHEKLSWLGFILRQNVGGYHHSGNRLPNLCVYSAFILLLDLHDFQSILQCITTSAIIHHTY